VGLERSENAQNGNFLIRAFGTDIGCKRGNIDLTSAIAPEVQ
jgi:hypothetical protein